MEITSNYEDRIWESDSSYREEWLEKAPELMDCDSDVVLTESPELIEFWKKKKSDERIVRETLVKVWTNILDKYGRPGAYIPDRNAVYLELMHAGVDASVDAVVKEHWFVRPFMIRDQIWGCVEKELSRFDLASFIEEVKQAQNHPERLNQMKADLRRVILG